MVDCSSHWLELVPLKAMYAEACMDASVSSWGACFGVAGHISTIWQQLCTRLGTTHPSSTAYHQEASGMVEQFHRQLKQALKLFQASVEGLNACPGSCWACPAPPWRTVEYLQQSWSLELPSPFHPTWLPSMRPPLPAWSMRPFRCGMLTRSCKWRCGPLRWSMSARVVPCHHWSHPIKAHFACWSGWLSSSSCRWACKSKWFMWTG